MIVMRVIIPPEIKALFKIQEPYVYFDGRYFRLRDDAPPEAVEARKKAQEWFRAQGR